MNCEYIGNDAQQQYPETGIYNVMPYFSSESYQINSTASKPYSVLCCMAYRLKNTVRGLLLLTICSGILTGLQRLPSILQVYLQPTNPSLQLFHLHFSLAFT